jgi:hypothetical protein
VRRNFTYCQGEKKNGNERTVANNKKVMAWICLIVSNGRSYPLAMILYHNYFVNISTRYVFGGSRCDSGNVKGVVICISQNYDTLWYSRLGDL